MIRACGSGGLSGSSAVPAVIQPAGGERRCDDVRALHAVSEADSCAERGQDECGSGGEAEREVPPVRPILVQPPGRAQDQGGEVDRSEFGAVAPGPAQQEHAGRLRRVVVAGDEHHGLKAATADQAGVAAHPAVAGHARLRAVLSGRCGRVQLVA